MTAEMTMIAMGFMAKRVSPPPDWIGADGLLDVCSVSNCVSDDFADYIPFWKHNSQWFFNSPNYIQELARAQGIDLRDTRLFFYEAYPAEFDGVSWRPFELGGAANNEIVPPSRCECMGFDVVTFSHGTSPECSPLSCNSMAAEITPNSHCLFGSLREAVERLENGAFVGAEPGPYRIFAVHSVEWPSDLC